MKKRIIIVLVLLLLVTTSCKKDKVDLSKIASAISSSDSLVTNKVYYHNVAEYEGGSFLLRLLGIDKKVWIEYTGLTDLSIPLGEVKTTIDGDKIHVLIPKVKIDRCYVQNENDTDFTFYTPDGSIFHLGDVSSSEGTEAFKKAQNDMCEAVKHDTDLLRRAQRRAENLLKEKIRVLTEDSDALYSVIWEYADNIYE